MQAEDFDFETETTNRNKDIADDTVDELELEVDA